MARVVRKYGIFTEEFFEVNGIKEGVDISYYCGVITAFCNYINGENNGQAICFYDDGKLRDIRNFKNNEKCGCQKQYYRQTGNLKYQYYWEENSSKEIEYYDNVNSNIKHIYNYNKDHNWIGEQIYFYENGNILCKCNYKVINDSYRPSLDGEFIDYYENGKIKFKYDYVNGNKHGECIEYNREGEIVSKRYYKDNELISHPTYYYNYYQTVKNILSDVLDYYMSI